MPAANEPMTNSLRDRLRTAAFSTEGAVKSTILNFNGEEFELKAPTVGLRQDLLKKATVDGALDPIELYIWLAIECSCEPGTKNKIFADTDYNTFKGLYSGGFLDELIEVCPTLLNINKPDDQK